MIVAFIRVNDHDSLGQFQEESMPANPYKHVHFEGQQEDEVVLYLIHPHWLMLLARVLKALFRASFFFGAWFVANMFFTQYLSDFEIRGYSILLIVLLADLAWHFRFYSTYQAYITDRRIVVVKSLFPITIKRMTLFWKDAVKGRDIASSFIWRVLKIGTLEISAKLFQGFSMQNAKDNPLGSEIQIRYVKYFVEITNYIDNLIHLTAQNPEKIKDIKPLVFKAGVESPYLENIAHSVKES